MSSAACFWDIHSKVLERLSRELRHISGAAAIDFRSCMLLSSENYLFGSLGREVGTVDTRREQGGVSAVGPETFLKRKCVQEKEGWKVF